MFEHKSLFRALWVGPSRTNLLITLFSIFVSGTSEIILRRICGQMGDMLIANTFNFIWVVFLLGVVSMYIIFSSIASYGYSRLEAQEYHGFYFDLEHKLINGEQCKLDCWDIGNLTTLLARDTDIVIGFLNRFFQDTITDAVSFLVSIIVLMLIHPLLPVVALTFGILQVGISKLVNKPMREGYRNYQKSLDKANASVLSNLYNLESVKSNQLEEIYEQKDKNQLEELHFALKRSAKIRALFNAPATFSAFLALIALSVCGGYLAVIGKITIGSLIVSLTLSDSVVSPLMGLNRTITMYRQMNVSYNRIQKFLSVSEENKSDLHLQTIGKKDAPEICIKNLSFAYEGNSNILLKNITEDLKSGHIHFILGENGTGKSTLIKLIAGIYSPNGGDIQVDGVSISKWNRWNLRERFSIASQSPLLFAMSILDNIIIGNQTVSNTEVESICKAIGIHDEIVSLKDGYHTVLKDNGKPLSKGQRQRLTIARAILNPAEILIFDEPTSAIDTNYAESFIKLMRKLAQTKLVIIITHDLNLIDEEDHVIRISGREAQCSEKS
ncbi:MULTISPECIES: ABC transporter ATP-binding protein [Clostridium]|uniref:ABC transporter ATP-binding protein n=1 Tax=Clostridium TaxID=1485 RepID=UPI000824515C|nr:MULTISPECIES: ABC transporter ATP-binding protein [Clostridium]PJI10250.1 ABC transporter ATP-binding protein [Clostridium sp. CT7]